MTKIVFAHANGFPAGTYRALFEAWRSAGFEVHALPKVGHDPRFPVTSNWPHLRDQLVHFIEHEAGGPAHLVGHSLGGYLSLMAASRRPELAKRLRARRKLIADIVETTAKNSGRNTVLNPNWVGAVVLALEDGFRLHRLIDPETPADSFLRAIGDLQRAIGIASA